MSDCYGQPLLEIICYAISESLYFVVMPYICPISALILFLQG